VALLAFFNSKNNGFDGIQLVYVAPELQDDESKSDMIKRWQSFSQILMFRLLSFKSDCNGCFRINGINNFATAENGYAWR
jgi:hypothetical protein